MRFIVSVLTFLLMIPCGIAAENLTNSAIQEQTAIADINSQYSFDKNTLSGKVVKVKKGTILPITLLTPIDTSSAQENDKVEATLDNDLEIDGAIVAKKGSILYGKITKARSASYCMRGGKVKINFDKIKTTEDMIYKISTKAIEFIISEADKWITVARAVLEIIAYTAYVCMTGGTGIVVVAALVLSSSQNGLAILDLKGSDAIIPASSSIDISLSSPLKAIATY